MTAQNRPAQKMVGGSQSASVRSAAMLLASGMPIVNHAPYILTASLSPATQTASPAFPKDAGMTSPDPLFDAKLAASVAQADAKFTAVNGRADVLDAKFDAFIRRFDEFAARMATVPADIAALKATVATLPTKDDIGAKFRNWIGFGFLGVSTIVGLTMAGVRLFQS